VLSRRMHEITPERLSLPECKSAIARIVDIAHLLSPHVAGSQVKIQASFFLDALPQAEFRQVVEVMLHGVDVAEQHRVVRLVPSIAGCY
jgi:hypothetical protein